MHAGTSATSALSKMAFIVCGGSAKRPTASQWRSQPRARVCFSALALFPSFGPDLLAVRAISVAYEIQKGAMNAKVIGELRMKRCRHRLTLAYCDRIISFGGDHFHPRSQALDFGSADEDHLERSIAELAGTNRAVDLAAVGIAADPDVKRPEPRLVGIDDFFGQHNRARTGAESWLHADELRELRDSFFTKDFKECAGLSARDDEAVDFIELVGLADEYDMRAEFFEALLVGVEIALDC